MADNVLITPGSGVACRSKSIGGVQTQIVQLDIGGESAELQLVGDVTYGVPCDIKRFPAGAVIVNNPTAANLKVDASGATVPIIAASVIPVSAVVGSPVFVRLSDGTNPVATLPVSGTVTVNQGTPAAVANAFPIKVSDGTDTVGITTVGGTKAMKVDVVQTVGTFGALADRATFTEGTTVVSAIGGEYNDTPTGPTSGQAAAARITGLRALHINIRKNDGTELGVVATPLRTDPTGSTTQPVSGTVTVQLKDNTGTAYGPANPLYTTKGGRGEARVTKSVAITASQTGSVVWTPAGGKTFYIRKLILVLSVGGAFTLFDGTNVAANLVADGTWPVEAWIIDFDEPWPSAAVNNVLKYTTGASITGTLTAHGFEI